MSPARSLLSHSLRVVAFAALFLTPTALLAQGSQTGSVGGSIRGRDGALLPGVEVRASSAALLGERTAWSGETGQYLIRGLPPGPYEFEFSLEGLTTVTKAARVELGRTARVDAELHLARVEASIDVVARSLTILESTQVGANYTAEVVDALPIARGPTDIANLAPGISDRAPQPGQLAISGGFGYDSVFLVDGVDINDSVAGSPVVDGLDIDQGLYIEEAIEETQVLTAAISAEYGRFTGGVVNSITKSGGNRYSGTLRMDFTDPSWRDETPIEDELGKTRSGDRSEVVSASLGGPIVADRLWFFAAARDNQTTDPIFLPFTNALAERPLDDQRWQLKLTGNLADRHRLQLLYLDSDTSFTTPTRGDSIDLRTVATQAYPANLRVASYSGVLTPALFFEARYSARRQDLFKGGTSRNIIDSPFFTLTGQRFLYNAPFGAATEAENRDNEQLAASLSYFLDTERAGSHDLKFGLEDFTTTRGGAVLDSSTEHLFLADFLADEEGRPILDAQGRLQPEFRAGRALDARFFPVPGGERHIDALSLYLHDRWRLSSRWSLDLGLRYEDVTSGDSAGAVPVETSSLVPRLAVTLDPLGDGRYKLSASYGEYAGGYNQEFYHGTSRVARPDIAISLYAGPPGVGFAFAPGFDSSNYTRVVGGAFIDRVFREDGLRAPISEEITLSAGMSLGAKGYLEATYTDRSLTGMAEGFITLEGGTTLITLPNGQSFLNDNFISRNTDDARREYEAIQLQGRYRLRDNWHFEGHWTYQLANDGNYEGESGASFARSSLIGDYPELLVAERNFPFGRLDDFQEHRIRLWTTWASELGRAGDLDLGLLLRYDSGITYSLMARNAPLSDVQRARDPGYARPPGSTDLFFEGRGSRTFAGSAAFDLAATHSIPAGKRFEPWVKLEIHNLLNTKRMISWDTSIGPDPESPVDADGLPTGFIERPTFGQALSPDNFTTPREYRLGVGVRF